MPRFKRPHCRYCDKPLRRFKYRIGGPNPIANIDPAKQDGDYGDNHFCGLRCGYEFALVQANAGRRIERKGVIVGEPR